jgi:hypothetical protein
MPKKAQLTFRDVAAGNKQTFNQFYKKQTDNLLKHLRSYG